MDSLLRYSLSQAHSAESRPSEKLFERGFSCLVFNTTIWTSYATLHEREHIFLMSVYNCKNVKLKYGIKATR